MITFDLRPGEYAKVRGRISIIAHAACGAGNTLLVEALVHPKHHGKAITFGRWRRCVEARNGQCQRTQVDTSNGLSVHVRAIGSNQDASCGSVTVTADELVQLCEAAYRRAAQRAHPDRGGSREDMQALNRARG